MNINEYVGGTVDREDPIFVESNRMHSINGYVFDNLQYISMAQGEKVENNFISKTNSDKVRFYIASIGDDLHTPHFHGQPVSEMGYYKDALQTLPVTSGYYPVFTRM
jgi:hypothetical protein